jgi:hypothetical protein
VTDSRHWRATSRNPHEKSTAAFLLTGHELLVEQEGPALPLWIIPPKDEEIEPHMQQFWSLQKPMLQMAADARRRHALGLIDKIIRPDLAGKYDHPDVKCVVAELVQGQQLLCKMLYDALDRAPDMPLVQPENAIMYCVKAMLNDQHPGQSDNALNEMTAKLMSRGIPIGEARSYGTNRNHVRRAARAFLQSVGRVVNRFEGPTRDSVLLAQFGYWRERVAALMDLEAGAANEPRFRGLSGKALAEAIDTHPGMLTAFLRQSAREAA